MTVEHLQELHGLPTFVFPSKGESTELPAAEVVAWSIAASPYSDETESFTGVFERFLATVDVAKVRALIIGQWGEPYDNSSDDVIELLVAAKDRLTSLEALFIGDLEAEEAEISWIEHGDVTPVLAAYPRLRELGVRGGTGLLFPPVRHEALRTLTFEAGGLPGEVVRGVVASDLPALEYLEMWLGVEEYGGDATVADLAPLLDGGRFPRLRHLGLRNSEIQDEIATAVAAAPVVAQLASLDLSLGVLSDAGALALLDGQPLTHLKWIDLHHNFVTEEVANRLRAAWEPAGVEVGLSETGDSWEDGDEIHRYTAVAE
ncbi:STM4015 family protein [Streptomyces sp. 71268]|uniref:STM4015 family protein n=1 Tax=Streptomyces sp. 71268 TaxID=3002640 RepID=UPI0023F81C12|nr:STM4015 family protein [Streptomyces sp. 71268]WEV28869.1 STM4015 family protein [Streptomyces sp. 71268]